MYARRFVNPLQLIVSVPLKLFISRQGMVYEHTKRLPQKGSPESKLDFPSCENIKIVKNKDILWQKKNNCNIVLEKLTNDI